MGGGRALRKEIRFKRVVDGLFGLQGNVERAGGMPVALVEFELDGSRR